MERELKLALPGMILTVVGLALLISAGIVSLGCHEELPSPPTRPTPHAFLSAPTVPSSIEEYPSFTRGEAFGSGYNEDKEDHVAGCSFSLDILTSFCLPCIIVGLIWFSCVDGWLLTRKESPRTTSSYNINQTGPLSCSDVELGRGAPVPNPPMHPPPNNTYPTPHPNRPSAAILK